MRQINRCLIFMVIIIFHCFLSGEALGAIYMDEDFEGVIPFQDQHFPIVDYTITDSDPQLRPLVMGINLRAGSPADAQSPLILSASGKRTMARAYQGSACYELSSGTISTVQAGKTNDPTATWQFAIGTNEATCGKPEGTRIGYFRSYYNVNNYDAIPDAVYEISFVVGTDRKIHMIVENTGREVGVITGSAEDWRMVTVWQQASSGSAGPYSTWDPYNLVFKGFKESIIFHGMYVFVDASRVPEADYAPPETLCPGWGGLNQYNNPNTTLMKWELHVEEGCILYLDNMYYSCGGFLASNYATDQPNLFIAEQNLRLERFGPGFTEIDIENCVADDNTSGGINAPSRTLLNCSASNNQGFGLNGQILYECDAEGNNGIGISGQSATTCTARANGAAGLVADRVYASRSEENQANGIESYLVSSSISSNNSGWGIIGSAVACSALYNLNGISNGDTSYQRTVSNSKIIGNLYVGVSGAQTLEDCEIRANGAWAVEYAQNVMDCQITQNRSGLLDIANIAGSYIASNTGIGVRGGTIKETTVIGNTGKGMENPDSVTDSSIVFNADIGVDSARGSLTSCTIVGNAGIGIRNIRGVVKNCNLHDNGIYDCYDSLNDAFGGYPSNVRDFRNNYWGSALTAEMAANPFPSSNISRIYDLWDSGLDNGWYINYGAAGQYAGAPIENAGSKSPAYLAAVLPDMRNPVNIGLASFVLTFSRPMDQSVQPAVTFGVAAPYTSYVVEPRPGWVGDKVWQGRYAIQRSTGNGRNVLRLAGARAKDGFIIPDDTAHSFTVDTSGTLSANSGLASSVGNVMILAWGANNKPEGGAFNVRMSTTGEYGQYSKVNKSLVLGNTYVLHDLPNGSYWFIVDMVDLDSNSMEWTHPFNGIMKGQNAVGQWDLYE